MSFKKSLKFCNERIIPDWLKENLANNCPYCKSEMFVGINQDGRVTEYFCSNKTCVETLAVRGGKMFELLEISGIGKGTCRQIIKNNNITDHIHLIKELVTGTVTIPLDTFMRIHFFKGIDEGWKEYTSKARSLDELLLNPKVQKIVGSDADRLRENIKIFNIKFPKVIVEVPQNNIMNVMITGNINGFANREDFIKALNYELKGQWLINLYTSIRKTGVDVVIKEDSSPITQKVKVAKDYGIKVMNSVDFIKYVLERVNS